MASRENNFKRFSTVFWGELSSHDFNPLWEISKTQSKTRSKFHWTCVNHHHQCRQTWCHFLQNNSTVRSIIISTFSITTHFLFIGRIARISFSQQINSLFTFNKRLILKTGSASTTCYMDSLVGTLAIISIGLTIILPWVLLSNTAEREG